MLGMGETNKSLSYFIFGLLVLTILPFSMMDAYAVDILGFTGPYAPALWTFFTDGDGSVDTSGAPAFIMMTGSDFGTLSDKVTDFTIPISCDGTVMFSWEWENLDISVNFDFGGYLIDGVFTQITALTVLDSGTTSVPISAGEVFGFRILATDDQLGPGVFMMIESFKAPDCSAPIGGTFIPIDTTALLLAGVQSISMWMIPVVIAGIGIGVFVIKRR